MAPQSLHPLTFPLHGQRLIEASAGTGKTFTITGLYLRLLLGHGLLHEKADPGFSGPLGVERILVVTFTEAATQELRARIRSRIHDARLAFSRGESQDPFIASLLLQVPHHQQAEQILLRAERQMDEAAIYTIHGFCQRMLTQNAFESGSLFHQEFMTDESLLRERAVADFWRRDCYPLPKPLAAMVRSYWASPSELLKEIEPYLFGPLVKILAQEIPDNFVDLHEQNLARICDLKKRWCAASTELETLISASGVDKRSYSKTSLPKWLDEIAAWAAASTFHYDLPKNLFRFSAQILSEKTKKGAAPVHPVFDAISSLLLTPPTLKDALTAKAIVEVRYLLSNEKKRFGWLSFDDLLSQLSHALEKDTSGILSSRIRTLYPVAMIDEFQDTDPQQYHIFSEIYPPDSDSGLFMIGDPKQAIYAFRGADIFTYIHARRQVLDHYNLDTNWRSSASMVEAVNRLFSFAKAPFIYDDDIPFYPVFPAPNADKKHWIQENKPQPALTFWLDDLDASGEGALQSKSDYENKMADACAISVRDVLNGAMQEGAFLFDGEKKKPIEAGDIAVLVRTGKEAEKVKKALVKQGIASVYLSNRNSVFTSILAGDVQRLLCAVLVPESERTLKAALGSTLFSLSAQEMDALNHEEALWEKAVVEFSNYQTVWFSRGVLPMLHQLIARRALAERLLAQEEGERLLTDLLHLGELLQEASQELESHHALLRWLAEHIDKPNGNAKEQQVRLESERDLVQIVTIHKSKGLEYNLVYLPFPCTFRSTKQPFYHDEDQVPTLVLSCPEPAILKAEKERLAEDLRLIYVAITRAVYGCFIGLGPIKDGMKSKGDSGVHLSGLGYLIQGGEPCDGKGLYRALLALIENQAQMRICPPPVLNEGTLMLKPQDNSALSAQVFRGYIRRDWRLTSYSHLIKQGHSASLLSLPAFDVDAANDKPQENELTAASFSSIFQFPRGARPGTFLHTLFESVDFSTDFFSDEVEKIILRLLALENYDAAWLPVLQTLLATVLSVSLNDENLRLSSLSYAERLTEMEFMLPIEGLSCVSVNRLIQRLDPLSARAGNLDFDTVRGMLKGFIDLVFCWEGRYFILDWKSNYLGDTPSDHTGQAIENAMIEHRYDFQYQIYSLALHRFLRLRIPDYSYSRHFGGVYYLFIRGMEKETQHGIFFTQPDTALIEGLDALFSGLDLPCDPKEAPNAR